MKQCDADVVNVDSLFCGRLESVPAEMVIVDRTGTKMPTESQIHGETGHGDHPGR
jgi:hypothetical protein